MTKIETIAKLDAVARVSDFLGRHYITLSNTSRAHKGDSRKVWVKGDVLTAEPYKGYMSDGAIASLEALCAAATDLGMTVVR